MTQEKKKDALLITAKVVTVIVRVGLVIGMIGLGIAGAVTAIGGGLPGGAVKVTVEPASLAQVTGAVLFVMAVALVSFGLMYDFVARLAQVIDTVGEGDPFTLANAARLRRMAWLALIVQLLGIPSTLLATWLDSHVEHGTFELRSDFSFTGFALALVLFILARVFAKGAEMRADLEGTV